MIKNLDKVRNLNATLGNFFVERTDEIHLLTLALLSGRNMLLLGNPGTAKTQLVTCWASLIADTKKFSWMLTKYSTPEEIFGPFSLKGLEEDRYVRNTAGKAPEANITFLDEIFKASSSILNSLLSLINEHKYYNDGVAMDVPLYTFVGASNEIPEADDGLSAMFDRLVLKYVSRPIQEKQNFIKMLSSGVFNEKPILTLKEIDAIKADVQRIILPDDMVEMYAVVREKLAADELSATDRTYKYSIDILKAEAYVAGREQVAEQDFDVLQHVLWTNPDSKKKIYTMILDIINPLKNKIIELRDDALDVYDKTMTSIKTKTDKNAKAEVMKDCLEAAAKIREIKAKLFKHENTLKDQKKDTKEIKKIQQDVEKYLDTLFSEIGIPGMIK